MNKLSLVNHFSLCLEMTNSYITVVIDNLSSTSVTCKFLNIQTSSIKSCSIQYGPNTTCENLPYSSQVEQFTNNTIDVILPPFPQFQKKTLFCFALTANNGKFTVVVKGTFHAGKFCFCGKKSGTCFISVQHQPAAHHC